MPAWEPGEIFSLRLGTGSTSCTRLARTSSSTCARTPSSSATLEAPSPQRDKLGGLARATFAAAEREGPRAGADGGRSARSEELKALGYVGDNE